MCCSSTIVRGRGGFSWKGQGVAFCPLPPDWLPYERQVTRPSQWQFEKTIGSIRRVGGVEGVACFSTLQSECEQGTTRILQVVVTYGQFSLLLREELIFVEILLFCEIFRGTANTQALPLHQGPWSAPNHAHLHHHLHHF